MSEATLEVKWKLGASALGPETGNGEVFRGRLGRSSKCDVRPKIQISQFCVPLTGLWKVKDTHGRG